VHDGLAEAAGLRDAEHAAHVLGNGTRAMAQDTVPFALWVADHFLDDYPGALAACVAAGGDVDTTCAIAGGVVAAHTGPDGIPDAWLASREQLPPWL
jgi:ADP-ribosylglycohydrolase